MDVPPAVRAKATIVGATHWLEQLPTLVAVLEEEWSITVGTAFDDATEAFVAEATCHDGAPAVVKLAVPRPGDHARREIAVLRETAGDGCARLLRADDEREALLLERLGPPLRDLGLPLSRRLEVLSAVAMRVWRPAGAVDLPTGADRARHSIEAIPAQWEELDRPCREAAVDHAVACAARRLAANDDERAVLVHGDVHQWNALAAGSGYKLVDPDGLRAEAELDLGVLIREDPVELVAGDPRARAGWLASRTGLDPAAIWEWGVVDRVATGLACTAIELQPSGRQMLAAADQIAAAYRDVWSAR